jgi:hypothetical protein
MPPAKPQARIERAFDHVDTDGRYHRRLLGLDFGGGGETLC